MFDVCSDSQSVDIRLPLQETRNELGIFRMQTHSRAFFYACSLVSAHQFRFAVFSEHTWERLTLQCTTRFDSYYASNLIPPKTNFDLVAALAVPAGAKCGVLGDARGCDLHINVKVCRQMSRSLRFKREKKIVARVSLWGRGGGPLRKMLCWEWGCISGGSIVAHKRCLCRCSCCAFVTGDCCRFLASLNETSGRRGVRCREFRFVFECFNAWSLA